MQYPLDIYKKVLKKFGLAVAPDGHIVQATSGPRGTKSKGYTR
jgi:hypothetical protein